MSEKAAITTPVAVSEKTDISKNEPTSESMSPLERLTSRVSAVYAPEGCIEATASAGIAMMVNDEPPRHHYVFARLGNEMPRPGKMHYNAMVGTLFLVMFLAGWNDGSQGPLLPSLQEYYNVDYLIISIIWIFNALGFFLSGVTNVWLTDRFGFGIVAPLGAISQMSGYIFMCWGGPYELFCFAFVLVGFGLGLQDAQVNSLVSRMPHANTLMFLMHAVYGLGATMSPLVSTQFVKHVQKEVYYYYAVSLGLGALTAIMLISVFRFRTDDQILGPREPEVIEGENAVELTPEATHDTDASQVEAQSPPPSPRNAKGASGSGSKMKRLLRSPTMYFLSVYILIYVGVEVTIGGWATSFLIDERGGNDSSGYVSSGYFGGLTLGRVILIPVTSMLGQWNAVWVYTAVAIALEVVVWTVRSFIGDAVAYAFVGVALGPMYPIVMMVIVAIIPQELQGGAIGLVASLGQVGSAMLPFITGAISQHTGVWVLQPLMVALLGFSLLVWALVPRKPVKA